jgi:hypothetical protein
VLLDAVAKVAKPVRLAYLWRPTLPDVNDDMVLEVAVNGRADGIVTFIAVISFWRPSNLASTSYCREKRYNDWRESREEKQFCTSAAAIAARRSAKISCC